MLVDLTRRARLAGDCGVARVIVFRVVFDGRGEGDRSSVVIAVQVTGGSIIAGGTTTREAPSGWLGYGLGMDLTSMVETRPGVGSGKPCFIGTRIAVYDVLDYVASGMSSAETVDDFPELTEVRVRAAIGFAAT